jgi:hypothetical protein
MSSIDKVDKAMGRDRRRKHPHWLVTLSYFDKDVFGRVYTDRRKAEGFAARQKKSPMVKSTRIERIS